MGQDHVVKMKYTFYVIAPFFLSNPIKKIHL
jgi:hypothetical protein